MMYELFRHVYPWMHDPRVQALDVETEEGARIANGTCRHQHKQKPKNMLSGKRR